MTNAIDIFTGLDREEADVVDHVGAGEHAELDGLRESGEDFIRERELHGFPCFR